MNSVLSSLGLIRKAGRLTYGSDAAVDAIRSGKATVVVVACDASENTKKRLSDKAKTYGVRYEEIPFTRAELGQAIGKESCACTAICGDDFAGLFDGAKNKNPEVNKCQKKN